MRPSIQGERECPSCGQLCSASVVARDENRAIGDDEFSYAICGSCGLWFLLDPPQDLSRWYAEDYYRTPTPEETARVARRERYQIELLQRTVQPPGRLVEIGAAWGVFAWQARDAGFDVHAVEMDARCCEHLRNVVGVEATASSDPAAVLASLPPSRAIVLWQVLEHLLDPLKVLDACAANLEPGGVLLCATPNPHSLGMRVLGRHWPHLDAPRHVSLIPPELLRRWAEDRGLEQVLSVDTDVGARRWNRFSWQRVLLNRVRVRAALPPLLVAGALVSAAVSPWEARPGRGSSYTAAFRKVTT
jgi:SAM-dependent methyltransferase